MQREITKPGKLLNNEGELNEKGYATSLLLEYNRKDIKVSPWRIKEWDYYLITNDNYSVALTIADNGYMGLLSVSLLDFKLPWFRTTSVIKPLTFGKIKLPSTSKIGDVQYKDKRIEIEFLNDGETRHLKCKMKSFHEDKDFECDLILENEPKDSMVIATPFKEDKKAFYYNQKIVGMSVNGYVKYDGKLYSFKEEDSRAILDWGRGVWTYKNTWYWGAAAGIVDGKEVGWNIGYGFGDTSVASENMLFYEGKSHKLDGITFNIPEKDGTYRYMEQWKFSSNDKRFQMTFDPIIDRKDSSSVCIISSNQHQVFGKFNGTVVLNNGEVINIIDMLGFAERVQNKW